MPSAGITRWAITLERCASPAEGREGCHAGLRIRQNRLRGKPASPDAATMIDVKTTRRMTRSASPDRPAFTASSANPIISPAAAISNLSRPNFLETRRTPIEAELRYQTFIGASPQRRSIFQPLVGPRLFVSRIPSFW